MDRSTYERLERYMLAQMNDSAHDRQHVYRVLYLALDIADSEPAADGDVLIAACLLHDIGRQRQFENPALCHAREGGRMAEEFLLKSGFDGDFAGHVGRCIASHRYRGDNAPGSLEAKILFDADKLDATGAFGVARTLLYNGKLDVPLYSVDAAGHVLDGSEASPPSFFQEYRFKLRRLYDLFYTERGRELAKERRQAAVCFYESLLSEARAAHEPGRDRLARMLAE